MPSPQRSHIDIGRELVEADLNAGFALLDYAEDESLFGTPETARQVVEQAECACAHCRWRILGLCDADFVRLQPQLEKLECAVAAMRSRFTI